MRAKRGSGAELEGLNIRPTGQWEGSRWAFMLGRRGGPVDRWVKVVVACFESQTEEFQNYVEDTEGPLTKVNLEKAHLKLWRNGTC